jgi:hypothetical protein
VPQYIPLTSNDCDTPSLLINTQSSPAELHGNAAARILAATQLMESLSKTDIDNADGIDLKHIAQAATLLLRDGCDLLDVLGRQLRT